MAEQLVPLPNQFNKSKMERAILLVNYKINCSKFV